MASTAAMIGAVAIDLRLSPIDFTGMPARCSCIYRGTGSWTVGVADQKQRISKNFTYSSSIVIMVWDCIFIEGFYNLES